MKTVSRRTRQLALGMTLSALALVLVVQLQDKEQAAFPIPTIAGSWLAQVAVPTNVYNIDQTTQGVLIKPNEHNVAATVNQGGTFPLYGAELAQDIVSRFWGYEYVGTEPPYTGLFLVSAGEKAANAAAPASTLTTFTRGRTYYFMTSIPLIFQTDKGLNKLFKCGDGIKQGSQVYVHLNINHKEEECDDGNTVKNDACSNECKNPDYDDAECVSITDAPATVLTGQTFTAKGTMKNTGTRTWTAAKGYLLAAMSDGNIWGPNTNTIPVEADVVKDTTATFTINATAPNQTGSRHFDWIMSLGGSQFGKACQQAITVNARTNNAQITMVVPDAVQGGAKFSAVIQLKNTGTKTWLKDSYALKITSQGISWGETSIALPQDVAPDATISVVKTLTAPPTPNSAGTRGLTMQMWDGKNLFGDTTSKGIKIEICGNKKVETGTEKCDDGNKKDGDGCSFVCAVESGFQCTTNNAGMSLCSVLVPSY